MAWGNACWSCGRSCTCSGYQSITEIPSTPQRRAKKPPTKAELRFRKQLAFRQTGHRTWLMPDGVEGVAGPMWLRLSRPQPEHVPVSTFVAPEPVTTAPAPRRHRRGARGWLCRNWRR